MGLVQLLEKESEFFLLADITPQFETQDHPDAYHHTFF